MWLEDYPTSKRHLAAKLFWTTLGEYELTVDELFDLYSQFLSINESPSPKEVYKKVKKLLSQYYPEEFMHRINPGINPYAPEDMEELEELMEEYPYEPPFIQKKILVEINTLREKMGQPLIDRDLQLLVAEEEFFVSAEIAEPEIKEETPVDPHVEAREIYQIYLGKYEELRPEREHAKKIIAAVMKGGNNGILCDRCGKECNSHAHHVVAMQAVNGTVRVYHGQEPSWRISDGEYKLVSAGYGCVKEALDEDKQREDQFRKDVGWEIKQNAKKLLQAWIQDERPDLENELYAILSIYDYDPGIGVNRP